MQLFVQNTKYKKYTNTPFIFKYGKYSLSLSNTVMYSHVYIYIFEIIQLYILMYCSLCTKKKNKSRVLLCQYLSIIQKTKSVQHLSF